MSHSSFISREQIIKANFITDYIYGVEIKGECRLTFPSPEGPQHHMIFLITRGFISITRKREEQTFMQGTLLNIPAWTQIDGIKYSPDFHGMAVAVSKDLLLDIFRSRHPFPPSFIYRLRSTVNSPQLSSKEMKILIGDMHNLIGALGNKEHHYAQELTYAHLYILLTDIANVIWSRFGHGDPEHNVEMSRSEQIVKEFMELLGAKAETESKVEFYADTLCISKQYLSLVVREQIHASVGSVIGQIRFERACMLLKDPSNTIQQVADRMNFSDQSTFGKFFKRKSGMSPQRYRKTMRNNLLARRKES